MMTIEEERVRLAGYINTSATVFGPDAKPHGTVTVTNDEIIYSDGHTVDFRFPLTKATAVVNFFESCGSTIGPFGPREN